MRKNMGIYRGKRKDNGEWIVGYYFERKDTKGNIIEAVIIVDAYEQITNGQRYMRSNLNTECFRVDPETVGQFTGLTDNNGKKIFEGDILKRTNGNKYAWYVDYKYCAFCGNQSNCNYACELGELLDQIELEVVGNIHDNPELLEVSE